MFLLFAYRILSAIGRRVHQAISPFLPEPLRAGPPQQASSFGGVDCYSPSNNLWDSFGGGSYGSWGNSMMGMMQRMMPPWMTGMAGMAGNPMQQMTQYIQHIQQLQQGGPRAPVVPPGPGGAAPPAAPAANLQTQVTGAFGNADLRARITALLPAAGDARNNIINAIPAAGAILPANINGILTANGNAVRTFLTTLHGDAGAAGAAGAANFQGRLTAAITAAVPGAGEAVEQRREEVSNLINLALQAPSGFLTHNPRSANVIFPIIFRAIRPLA